MKWMEKKLTKAAMMQRSIINTKETGEKILTEGQVDENILGEASTR